MVKSIVLLLLFWLTFGRSILADGAFTPPTYKCGQGQNEQPSCIRLDQNNGEGVSLAECKITCGEFGQLWPKPTGPATIGNAIGEFNPHHVKLEFLPTREMPITQSWLKDTVDERILWLTNEAAAEAVVGNKSEASNQLTISLSWVEEADPPKIRRDTDESYLLTIGNDLVVRISAVSYFGLRHGLETLSQLMGFDQVQKRFIVATNVHIADHPIFKHRGVLIDSSRNFMPLSNVQNVLNGMASNKLNVLHWHLTDSQSFPIQLEKYGETTGKMAEHGAYGASKIYTVAQLKTLVEFANKRGVRIIPEFDAPAHVGNGWQFPGAEGFTVCYEKRPWPQYCVQPPCGQLNPMVEGMYEILSQIYDELFDIFQFDSFHFGGDEVDLRCWESSPAVTEPMQNEGIPITEEGFVEIWSRFQRRARSILEQYSTNAEHILWTSTLTEERHINNLENDYTIQIWTDASDMSNHQIQTLIRSGHNMIFSNVDALYMDCGFSAWIGEGLNWCAPYKSWQAVYGNNLHSILDAHGGSIEDRGRILGAELALWTENVSGQSFEVKLFPRASAHAERLWSNPTTTYSAAQKRLVEQTYRLLQRGISSDGIQPEYCRLNEGECYF